MTDMGRRVFHDEVRAIGAEVAEIVAELGSLVLQVTRALVDGDLSLVDDIDDRASQLPVRTRGVEERCIAVIALQAPMAVDLRRIIAALRVVPEADRSAGLINGISRAAHRLHPVRPAASLRPLLQGMGEQAAMLTGAAAEALANDDDPLALAVEDMDVFLDGLHQQLVSAVFESHASGEVDVQAAVQLAVVARFYERIGDHAVNIAEHVHFIVSGELPSHTSRSGRGQPVV